jgi:hypothetical protein
MIEINLIPDVKRELLRAERQRTTVISFSLITGIVGLGLVAALAAYVYGVQLFMNDSADKAIIKQYNTLKSVPDLSKYLTIQNQLEKVNSLHGSKHLDSRVYDLLDAVIPPAPNQVQVVTLTQDNELGTIKIEGQTLNYQAVEEFKKTIDGAQIRFAGDDGTEQIVKLASDISIDTVGFGQNSEGANIVNFSLTFTYAPELFAASTPSVTITLSNVGNVTDSYLGVPRSIFVNTEGAQ